MDVAVTEAVAENVTAATPAVLRYSGMTGIHASPAAATAYALSGYASPVGRFPGVTIVTVIDPAEPFFTTSVEPIWTVSDAAGVAYVGGVPAMTGTV